MKNNIYLTYGLMLLVVTGLTAQNEAALAAASHKKPTVKIALFYTNAALVHYSNRTEKTSGFQAQLGDQIRAYQNAIRHSGLDYHVKIVSNTLITPTTDVAIETLLQYTRPNVIVFIGDTSTKAIVPPQAASAYRTAVVSVDALIQNPLAIAASLHQAVTHTTPEFVSVPYEKQEEKSETAPQKAADSKHRLQEVSFSENDKTAFVCEVSTLNLASPDTAILSQSIRQTQTQSIIDVTHTLLITPGSAGATTRLSFDEAATDDNFLVFTAEGLTAPAPQCIHEGHNAQAANNARPGDTTSTSPSSTADNERNSTIASTPAAQLLTPYPNPTAHSINIPYMVERKSLIHLTIYDNMGHLVESLVLDEKHPTGTFTYQWDTRHVSSGVYLCFLEVNGTVERYRITKR